MKTKKTKKKKNQVIVVPTTQKSIKTKTTAKPSKTNALAYYNCLLTKAQQG